MARRKGLRLGRKGLSFKGYEALEARKIHHIVHKLRKEGDTIEEISKTTGIEKSGVRKILKEK